MSTLEVRPVSLSGPSLHVHRDLSLLEFQRRVLDEAQDAKTPLLERVKFMAIFGSNMDEFFMLRVSSIHRRMAVNKMEAASEDLDLPNELTAVRKLARELYATALYCMQKEILPKLEKSGIHLMDY